MKNKKNDHFIIWFSIFVIIVVTGLYLFSTKENPNQDKLDSFASCIADSGAKFYGASWCPHCKDQKELFGNSKNLPYIECSSPDGKSQLPICVEAKIKSYPTWVFKDGTKLSGKLSISKLEESTDCEYQE